MGTSMDGIWPFFGGALTLAGVAFIVHGWRQWSFRRNAMKAWPQVDGVVTSDSVGSDQSTASVVRFTTLDGDVRMATVESMVKGAIDQTGKTVPVWYDPADPSRVHARVRIGDNSWVPHALTGLVPLVIGVTILYIVLT